MLIEIFSSKIGVRKCDLSMTFMIISYYTGQLRDSHRRNYKEKIREENKKVGQGNNIEVLIDKKNRQNLLL